jgi:hypothetical protein
MQEPVLVGALISAFLTAVAFGAMWFAWGRKYEKFNISIDAHDKRIETLEGNRSLATDCLALSVTVANLQKELLAHHADSQLHRNRDSEKRMDDLMVTVTEFIKENRADHQHIMTMITGNRDDGR